MQQAWQRPCLAVAGFYTTPVPIVISINFLIEINNLRKVKVMA